MRERELPSNHFPSKTCLFKTTNVHSTDVHTTFYIPFTVHHSIVHITESTATKCLRK